MLIFWHVRPLALHCFSGLCYLQCDVVGLLCAVRLLPRGARRGVTVLADPSHLAAIRAHRARFLGLAGLTDRLGIGKAQTQRLVAAGLVPFHMGDGVERPNGRRYRLEEVEALLVRLARGAPARRTAPSDGVALPLAWRKAGIRLETACRRILDGEVQPVARLPGPLTLATIDVRWRQLKAPSRHAGLTLQDGASALRIHPEALRHLTRRRIIVTTGADSHRRISPEALQRFRTTMMTGVEAAQRLGVSPRRAIILLQGVGVVPEVGPPICRQVFYRRSNAASGLDRIQAEVRRTASCVQSAGAASNGRGR